MFIDPKRAGLGEARNECIGKGRADGDDESVRREAVKDVLHFLKDMR